MSTKGSKRRARYGSALIAAAVPTLLAGIYYGFFAADVYVSDAKIAVRAPQAQAAMPLPFLASPGESEAGLVRDQITGHDILTVLDERLGLRAHYASPSRDALGRLSASASREEFISYMRGRVHVGIDGVTGVLSLSVQAFEPRFAHDLANALISHAEAAINDLNDRIGDDVRRFAQEEVRYSEARLAEALAALAAVGESTSELDPQRSASGLMDLIVRLEGEIALHMAELRRIEAYSSATSPELLSLRAKIDALREQIATLRERITGTDDDLSSVVREFRRLSFEVEFAQNAYAQARAAQDQARTQSQGQRRYLVTVVAPSLPESAVLPDRLLSTFKIFAISLLVWLIGSLTFRAVREHGGL